MACYFVIYYQMYIEVTINSLKMRVFNMKETLCYYMILQRIDKYIKAKDNIRDV